MQWIRGDTPVVDAAARRVARHPLHPLTKAGDHTAEGFGIDIGLRHAASRARPLARGGSVRYASARSKKTRPSRRPTSRRPAFSSTLRDAALLSSVSAFARVAPHR